MLRSGDPEEDAQNLTEFNEAAAESTAIDDGPAGTKILRVGKNGWTLPLPLIKTDAGWRFRPRSRQGGNDQPPHRLRRDQRHRRLPGLR